VNHPLHHDRPASAEALACAVALAATALAPPAGGAEPAVTMAMVAPRIESVTYASAVLNRQRRFTVVLPDGFTRERRDWPVLYLFHGRGRHDRSLTDDDGARAALLRTRVVVVLPPGDDGWYINSPLRPLDRYADATDEVIALAEAQYGLSRDPAQRALAGWSMGGYGCVMTALNHPGQFAAVAPVIGLLDFPRTGLPADFSYEVPAARFGNDPATWAALNPITRAERLRGAAILIQTADHAFDRVMNEHFHARLDELGIAHRFEVLPGGHTFDVVRAALPNVVAFVNETLAPAGRP